MSEWVGDLRQSVVKLHTNGDEHRGINAGGSQDPFLPPLLPWPSRLGMAAEETTLARCQALVFSKVVHF